MVDHASQHPEIEIAVDGARRAIAASQFATALEQLAIMNANFPDNPTILEAQADAFAANDQIIEALKRLDRIIEIEAADALVWHKVADLLVQIREYAQAIGAYEASLKLDGNNAETLHDFGRVLYKLGDLQGAARLIEKSAAVCDEIAPWQSLATLAPNNPGYDHTDVLRIRSQFAKKLGQLETPQPSAAPKVVDGDRIRVGYFSSWFDKENYMKPVWALVNEHDRDDFEIHLFSDTSIADGIAGYRFNENDVLHETTNLANAKLVDAIRKSQIDILVDLNAYSTIERIGVFLTRPAPITVAWFNMYATSGFPGFDYIIGDQLTIKKEEEEFYCEKVIRLPQSYLSFTVTHDAPEVVDPPCQKNGYVTFGSLISQYKLTQPVLESWSEILDRVPNSRLFLANADLDSRCNREYVADKLKKLGVTSKRIEFRGSSPHHEFIKNYDLIDIALDGFPYNGGTTTMEAIWQGVPVITFIGDRWAARTSASILAGTPVEKFVSDSQQGYVKTATVLATGESTADQLSQLRHSMRETLLKCRVCNAASLARSMEDVYRKIALMTCQ